MQLQLKHWLLVSLLLHSGIFIAWSLQAMIPQPASHDTAPATLNVNIATAPNSTATSPAPIKPVTANTPHAKRITPDTELPTTNVEHVASMNSPEQPVAATIQPTALINSTLRSKVLTQVQHTMDQYFYYPLLAQRNGWQGHVILGFRVEANGKISNAHIARGSGFAILDESALTSLQRIQRIPEAEQWLQGNELELNMPVFYHLQGG